MRRFTPAEDAAIIRFFAAGLNDGEIAAELERIPRSINSRRRMLGLRLPNAPVSWDATADSRLRRLRAGGLPVKLIAEKLKRSEPSVRWRIATLKLPRVYKSSGPPAERAGMTSADRPPHDPIVRALDYLHPRASVTANMFRLDGRLSGPREIVAEANRLGAAIPYPTIAPHPGAFTTGYRVR